MSFIKNLPLTLFYLIDTAMLVKRVYIIYVLSTQSRSHVTQNFCIGVSGTHSVVFEIQRAWGNVSFSPVCFVVFFSGS